MPARLLREASELYTKGEKEKAYQKAVEAYIDGFEMAEPTLFAKDGSFGRSLEGQFTEFRNAIKQGVPPRKFKKRHLEIEANWNRRHRSWPVTTVFPATTSFLNSALIILREGLEAALILAAILAMLRVMGASEAIRYIHLGWILALVARRTDLDRHPNRTDSERPASREHGRIYFSIRGCRVILCRLLASYSNRGQKMAGVYPRQG